MTTRSQLSSTSRLGAGSSVLLGAGVVGGFGFALWASLTLDPVELIPAAVFLLVAVGVRLTRVRTTVTHVEMRFFQLGKTVRVPFGQVHGCRAHGDPFGLGAGLRWLGPGRWAMLSGDDYLDLVYDDGRTLLVSHRDAQGLAAEIMRHLAD